MALKGLLDFLQEAKAEEKLDGYVDASSGEISCVFLCCDLPYQYLNGYFQKLGENDFHPIVNRVSKLFCICSSAAADILCRT